jgi:hypothetical protein
VITRGKATLYLPQLLQPVQWLWYSQQAENSPCPYPQHLKCLFYPLGIAAELNGDIYSTPSVASMMVFTGSCSLELTGMALGTSFWAMASRLLLLFLLSGFRYRC